MVEDLENGYRIYRDTNNEIPEAECRTLDFVGNVNFGSVPTEIYRTSDNRYFALPNWELFIDSPYQRKGYAYEMIPCYCCNLKRKFRK